MSETVHNIFQQISNCIWSPVFIAICLLAGLYFSILTRFVQIRRVKEMFHLLFCKDDNNNKNKSGTTSFQSFSIALSGRVGTGNLVGVATAIAFGGPGAVIWMWLIAFMGAGTAFAESTLAQIYKENHNGFFRGGPAYFIEKGLNLPKFAMFFAILTVFSTGVLYPPIQSNSIAAAFNESFNIPFWCSGLIIAFLLGLIIIGGVKRIANYAQILAPFMALLYILVAIVILICKYDVVPSVFVEMVKDAFGLNPALAGILGSTISWGVKRGVYSNEAGQGTGAIVSGSADVSHPVKQGLAQAFSIYIDTLLVCSATALMVLACQTYNVFDSDGSILISNLKAPSGEPGVLYTSRAIGSVVGDKIAIVIIAFSLFLFAFSTLMAYYFYAETNLIYVFKRLTGNRLSLKIEMIFLSLLRFVTLFSVMVGTITNSEFAWILGDIGVGSMAWINIISILILSPQLYRVLKDYETQKRNGLEPVFDPVKLGIKNSDYWQQKAKSESTNKH